MEKRRILSIRITADQGGKTVRDVMRGELLFSEKLMSRIKYRENGIRLNGVRVRTTSVLKVGDLLELDITDPGESRSYWAEPPVRVEPAIRYEDEDLLIVDKPTGMVCHPSFGHYADSLANQIACYMGWTGTNKEIHMIGRLDRDTCGLVMIAKNAGAAGLLAKQREDGTMKKTYLAKAQGKMVSPDGLSKIVCIDRPIAQVPGVLMLRKTDPSGKEARTRYGILEFDGENTLAACRIEHGRTHQIRVHMASIGHPLVGDLLYGPGGALEAFERTGDPAVVREKNEWNPEMTPLGLCAWQLELRQPFTGENILVQAGVPEWAGALTSETLSSKIKYCFE